jgi:sporulation protein YlmC with PRC-barrel domain
MFFQLRLAFTAPVQLVFGNNSTSEDIGRGDSFFNGSAMKGEPNVLMKTSLLYGAAIAILGMAAASMSGQTQSTTASSSSSGYVQSSKLVGTKVKSSQGEEIGIIKDVVLDRNTGCMAYTVLSTGGGGTRVTGGGKTVAVPWAVYSPTSDLSVLTVTVDRERIYNAPVFDYARIDEYSRPDYINNVYGYYGVSPGAGVGVGVSTGTSTGTTTTTGGAGTAASPGAMGSPTALGTASPSTRASASPRATAAASPRATAAASPNATASASPPGGATASPSTRGTRGASGRPGATASPSGGGETASPSGPEESPPGAAGSPGERKKSPRHRETGRSPRGEPSTTSPSPEEQE